MERKMVVVSGWLFTPEVVPEPVDLLVVALEDYDEAAAVWAGQHPNVAIASAERLSISYPTAE